MGYNSPQPLPHNIGALGIDEKSSQAEAEARAIDAERKVNEEKRKKERQRMKEQQQLHQEKEKERQYIRNKYQLPTQHQSQDQGTSQKGQTNSTDDKKCCVQQQPACVWIFTYCQYNIIATVLFHTIILF